MRNLVLLSERRNAITVPGDSFPSVPEGCDHDASICSMARDPSADDGGADDHHHHHFHPDEGATSTPSSFYLTRRGILIATSSAAPDGVCWTCNLNEVVSVPEDPAAASSPCWFDVTYVDDLDALVCLSRRGAIVTVEKRSGVAELVGEFDNGIKAGCWSPDKEVLALYTHTDSEEGQADVQQRDIEKPPALMTMNAQFEVLAEVVPESNILPSASLVADEASVCMCWRPDGTAVAISSVDVSDNTRRIRTYSREDLSLVSIGRSEDGSGKTVPNLLAPAGIAWSGLGCSQMITAVQRKGKRADTPRLVVFFEPNGLRHKEFKLRPDAGWEETVVGLCWSCQSDLLAVTLHCTKGNDDDEDKAASTVRSKVQLWHRSNYHWYCKYELRYDGAFVTMVNFDEERTHDLAVAMRSELSSEILVGEYGFAWDTSTVSPDGTAASIDGFLLNFTPFRQALVPPPMYFATITMNAPVVGLSAVPLCAENTGGISWVVQLSDGSICLLGNRRQLEDTLAGKANANDGASPSAAPAVLARIELEKARTMRQFLILSAALVDNGEFVVRCIAVESANSRQDTECIVEIDVTINGECSSANVVARLPTEGKILRIANWSDTQRLSGALVELNDGSLLEYESSPNTSVQGSIAPSHAESLLEPCPWIAGLHSAESTAGQACNKRIVVGVSRRARLYFGERILSDACSSFILTPTHQFLSYATLGSRSQLRFIPLSALADYDPLMGSEENVVTLGEGYEPRNVERGSRVVAILAEAPTTVLQLPRGNLEGVYPRALVLPFVMHLIEKGRYGEAMEVMRRQKIDLNLFCDMDPFNFLDGGVASFIAQVDKIDYLNLFISCLFDGDITEWKYRVPAWFHRSTNNDTEESWKKKDNFDFPTKVNQVCIKMREVMMQFESDGKTSTGTEVNGDHYLLPILSTFAKQSPPKLEDALSMIRRNALSKGSPCSDNKSPLLGERAQSSIQYLAFLADYPLLFDTALGMYDFDLARAVARNSQMDPKGYLPLLKRLRSLPESMAKYEVDIRLERFESALTHLVRSVVTASDTTEASVDLSTEVMSKDDQHFERCLSFIEKHKLHRLGLVLYENNVTCRNKILVSLGERLLSEGDGQAAISIFCSVDPPEIDGAKKAAQICGDWQSFFALLDESIAKDSEESKSSQRMYFADEIANEIAAGMNAVCGKRQGYERAARILLDYSKDVLGAVDMLIKAEMWSEGRRIARLHGRNDLVKKCIDAAVSYGLKCIDDFDNRAIEFKETNKRYQKCLVLRKDAKRKEAAEGLLDAVADDTESTFSMASNLSNTSLRSSMSGSSVGSVTSVSSVISAGDVSTFSMISEEDVMKHKSKYNKLGGGKKKKKKKTPRRSRNRIMPGSEKELNELVGLLKFNCINEDYYKIITETIAFLLQVGKQSLAHALYESYNDLLDQIDESQKARKESADKEMEVARVEARREGRDCDVVPIECEAEINSLFCKQLPSSIQQVFSFLN